MINRDAELDPSYTKAIIDANPVWKLAFWMSEIDNENAPIGWSRYVWLASVILNTFDLTRKAPPKGWDQV